MLAWSEWPRFSSRAVRRYFLCSTSRCSLLAQSGETGKRSRYGDSLRAGRFDIRTQVEARDLSFSALFQTSSGVQLASHLMGTKILPLVYSGRVGALTTILHMASRLRMGGTISVFPLRVFMGCDGVTFTHTNRNGRIFTLLTTLYRAGVQRTENTNDAMTENYFINLGYNIYCILRHAGWYDLFSTKHTIIIL